MSLTESASRFTRWRRRIFFIAAAGGWMLLITALHWQTQRGPRSLQGATELLDIGALPVT